MEKVMVPDDEISDKFRSKKDIYEALKYQFNLHLPSYRRCPMSFIKALFNGTKSAVRIEDIPHHHVPSFRELSVKELWPHFKEKDNFSVYFPEYPLNQLPEREFFFGILAKMYPEQTRDLIKECYKLRRDHYMQDNGDAIEFTKDLKDQIDNILSYKTTRGRGLTLLKVKCTNRRAARREKIFTPDLSAFDDGVQRRAEVENNEAIEERSNYGRKKDFPMNHDN